MRRLVMATAAMLALAAAMPAGALTFNLIDTGGAGAGTQARAGFNAAAAYWSSVITNNITVNLDIGFQALNSQTLGQTSSAQAVVWNYPVYQALATGGTSALDQTAVSHLQFGPSASLAMTTDQFANPSSQAGYVANATRLDNDNSANNYYLQANTANLKALGITTDAFNHGLPAIDGSVVFNSDTSAIRFDFNPSDGVDANAYDFIGVAIHEIGHALGFESGVDTYDYYAGSGPGAACLAAGTCPGQMAGYTNLQGFAVGNVLDLYRYSAPGNLDWSTSNVAKYFSIDGGTTNLFGNSFFATGTYNGDGAQASHWRDSAYGLAQIGVMDPTSAMGQVQDVTANDLAAFDAMGYNLDFDVLANPNYRQSTSAVYAMANAGAVPEPSIWAQLMLGFGLIGAALRRRAGRTQIPLSA